MVTKTVSSTEAQNNFGRVLDDVTQNRTRYIISRRGSPQAIILSFEDFEFLLENEGERRKIGSILRELQPKYKIGQILGSGDEAQ